jgi:hypothetical protein
MQYKLLRRVIFRAEIARGADNRITSFFQSVIQQKLPELRYQDFG